MITERQSEILDRVIREYIHSAQPVSSTLLEKKYDFGICPATIRIEMQKLTDKGFLYQPHTSAGRIPTDKGYRFFVDKLLKKKLEDFKIENWLKLEEEKDNTIKFVQLLTKNLAFTSRALALIYFEEEKILWKEGWEEILREPEFRQEDYIFRFTKLLENFENNISDLEFNFGIKIYIGKENPFQRINDFSIILSRCCLLDKDGLISLFGPKRMDYDRNISLINSVTKLLEKI